MKALKRFITITWLLFGSALFAANEQDVIASVEYFYAQDGTLIGRAINGVRQNFEYDKRGQLLAVKDAAGRDLERYTYDPAGNRLSKTVYGITTTYTYDEANQLKTSTVNGKTTNYRYDAAGRLVQAGDKTYYYFGTNDKVTEVRQGDKVIAEFDYFMDGQIASAKYPDREERFTWDGLALVQRNEVSYLNEPYVTGGNPILSSRDGVMFNDMLGSTLNIGGQLVSMTSFGETEDDAAFFTGKPMIPELGYSFLFRDYNPSQGKWTSSDPLGYPDGWNNLAYCNNEVNYLFDLMGLLKIVVLPKAEGDAVLDRFEQLVVGYWENNTEDYLLVYARNTTEAKKTLSVLSKREAITELIFTGHGSPSLQYVGSVKNSLVTAISVGSFNNQNNKNDFYDDIVFSKNAKIMYEGCHTGLSFGKVSLGQMTADRTGCITFAMQGETMYEKFIFYERTLGDPITFTKRGE